MHRRGPAPGPKQTVARGFWRTAAEPAFPTRCPRTPGLLLQGPHSGQQSPVPKPKTPSFPSTVKSRFPMERRRNPKWSRNEPSSGKGRAPWRPRKRAPSPLESGGASPRPAACHVRSRLGSIRWHTQPGKGPGSEVRGCKEPALDQACAGKDPSAPYRVCPVQIPVVRPRGPPCSPSPVGNEGDVVGAERDPVDSAWRAHS